MKQVIFAIALLAMASLTGCLNTEDSPVDENIDTTDDSTSDTTEDNSDTTDDTKEDELIEPVVNSNVTSPDLTEIEILLDSISDQLSELENIATALETSNEQMENSYYQPEEQSSVSIAGIEISKNGKTITVDCSERVNSGLILEIYTDNQILIIAENSHWSGALNGCHQSSKELELKRVPVIACISYFTDIGSAIENMQQTGDDTRPLAETIKTCNTF